MVIGEFGIYWMHIELHDIKPLYKYLHATHHIYNKQNTLSPFAGEYVKYSIISILQNHSHVKLLLFFILYFHIFFNLLSSFGTVWKMFLVYFLVI